MELGEIKRKLQEHFTDGLVTIVGSGLSVACGLPNMQELAEELRKQIALIENDGVKEEWVPIRKKLLSGVTLEEALRDIAVDNPIIPHILKISGDFVSAREKKVLSQVYEGKMRLPFSSVLPYLSFSSDRINVVTTNYDRLIEIAAEISGFGIDTLFPGQYYGRFDPELRAYPNSLEQRNVIMAQTK